MDKKSIFARKKLVPLFALLAVFSWGCAFPLIKEGMIYFQIVGDDTAAKTLFAGVRFTLAGLAVSVPAGLQGKGLHGIKKQDWGLLGIFSLVNTALHYFFFYIGLSNTPGSRAAILDALGTFFLIILAAVIFQEKMTGRKVAGCLLGLAGILILNLGGDGGSLRMEGDGMMVLNAICAAFGGILTRIVTKRTDAVAATGISLFAGGVMLMAAGGMMGGRLTVLTWQGMLVMLGLVAISAVSFVLYNQLLAYHPVGKIAIYNALIPVAGACLSCLVLKEPFYLRYIPAGIFVMSGVYAVNCAEQSGTQTDRVAGTVKGDSEQQ